MAKRKSTEDTGELGPQQQRLPLFDFDASLPEEEDEEVLEGERTREQNDVEEVLEGERTREPSNQDNEPEPAPEPELEGERTREPSDQDDAPSQGEAEEDLDEPEPDPSEPDDAPAPELEGERTREPSDQDDAPPQGEAEEDLDEPEPAPEEPAPEDPAPEPIDTPPTLKGPPQADDDPQPQEPKAEVTPEEPPPREVSDTRQIRPVKAIPLKKRSGPPPKVARLASAVNDDDRPHVEEPDGIDDLPPAPEPAIEEPVAPPQPVEQGAQDDTPAAAEPAGDEQPAKEAIRKPATAPRRPPAPKLQQTPEGETVGEVLRKAREKLEMDLSAVAQTTHIRTDYIKMIEDGQAHDLPVAPIYTKSYVKTISRIYNLDPEALVQRVSDELTPAESDLNTRNVSAAPRHVYQAEPEPEEEQRKKRLKRYKQIGWGVGTVVLLALIVFLWMNIANRLADETAVTMVEPLGDDELEELVVLEILDRPTELPVPSE